MDLNDLPGLFDGFWGWVLALWLVLVLLMPLSMYAAQKWAYRCWAELRKIRQQGEK